MFYHLKLMNASKWLYGFIYETNETINFNNPKISIMQNKPKHRQHVLLRVGVGTRTLDITRITGQAPNPLIATTPQCMPLEFSSYG